MADALTLQAGRDVWSFVRGEERIQPGASWLSLFVLRRNKRRFVCVCEMFETTVKHRRAGAANG